MAGKELTVAYVIGSLSFGGAERQLRLLVPALPERFKPVVISLSEAIHPFGSELRSLGVEVIALKRRHNVEPRRLWQTARIIRARKADIVHGFLDSSNPYAFLAGRSLGKPSCSVFKATRFS